MAAISAHGPRTGTIEAFAKAPETGAEYVEFDIRRTADGELAAYPRRAHAAGRAAGRHQLLPAVRAGRLPGAAGGGRDGD